MKQDKQERKLYRSTDVAEIFSIMRKSEALMHTFGEDLSGEIFPEPYQTPLLSLLQETNPLPLMFYFVEEEEKYAFFSIYENRLNLLTYGKAQWYMKVQTIGFPCSLSCTGYVTNDEEWFLNFVRSIRGCKLVLNVDRLYKIRGMACGETLPTCKLTLDPKIKSIDDYIGKMRSDYRRRLKLSLRRCGDIRMEQTDGPGNGGEVYPLYLQTFEKSEYKLECLEQRFFEEADATKLIFYRGEKPVGFVLLHGVDHDLTFLFCGMDYGEEVRNADLYYLMLLRIVEYAIEHGYRTIDFGQTSEKTKLKFGAQLEKKYFYAHHTNPFLNLVAMLGRHILEYTYDFPEFRVFKDEE